MIQPGSFGSKEQIRTTIFSPELSENATAVMGCNVIFLEKLHIINVCPIKVFVFRR